MRVPVPTQTHQHLLLSIVNCSQSNRALTAAHVVFILISPMTKRSQAFSMFYLYIFSASAGLFCSFLHCHFLVGGFKFFINSFALRLVLPSPFLVFHSLYSF